jgi:uncharacterized protein
MPTALLLIGRDRYADPWHDFAATGACIAREMTSLGMAVEWRSTFPDTFASFSRPDLVVVLAGRGVALSAEDDPGADTQWADFHGTLAGFVAAGTALLALHSAANTFEDSPHWVRLIGGRWVEGKSTHPPIGDAIFDTVGSHPIVSGMGSIHAFDERYCDLEMAESSQPFLVTRQGSAVHPVAWAAAPTGRGRAVYDGMGHDTRSYDSEGRVALLRYEISWLLAGVLAHES